MCGSQPGFYFNLKIEIITSLTSFLVTLFLGFFFLFLFSFSHFLFLTSFFFFSKMVSSVVKLLTLDTAPNTVFLVGVFMSAPCPPGFLLPVALLQTGLHDRPVGPYCDSGLTGLSVADVHTQKAESVPPAHKDICEGPNYYGLYYKCVSKHFIINWNSAS